MDGGIVHDMTAQYGALGLLAVSGWALAVVCIRRMWDLQDKFVAAIVDNTKVVTSLVERLTGAAQNRG